MDVAQPHPRASERARRQRASASRLTAAIREASPVRRHDSPPPPIDWRLKAKNLHRGSPEDWGFATPASEIPDPLQEPSGPVSHLSELRQGPTEIANALGISRMHVYRILTGPQEAMGSARTDI